MSTIMRALRRLEDEKVEQAAQERLHGEVVAPLSAGDASGGRPAWRRIALIALVVLALLGGAAYGAYRNWMADAGPAPLHAEAPAAEPPADATARRPAPTAEQIAARRALREERRAARAARQAAAAVRVDAAAPPPAEAGIPATAAPTAAERSAASQVTLTSGAVPVGQLTADTADMAVEVRPIDTFPIQERVEAEPASAAPRQVAAVRTATPPTPTATPAPARAPTQPARSWRTSPKADEGSSAKTLYGAQKDFEVVVVRTIWHPQLDRRVVHVRRAGSERVEVLKEGEMIGSLTVDEIGLSDVVFEGAEGPVRRRVGEER